MNAPETLYVTISGILLGAFAFYAGWHAHEAKRASERAAWALQRDYLVADLKESKYQRDVLSETALAYYRQLPKRNLKGQFTER